MKEFFDVQGEPEFKNPLQFIRKQLTRIEGKIDKVMATQDQEAAQLTALATEIGNISAGIDALEAALAAGGGTTPAVDAALAQVQAAADAALAKLPAPAPTPTPTATPPKTA